MSELAETNLQPVHFTQEKSEALEREMICIGSYTPPAQARDLGAQIPSPGSRRQSGLCLPPSHQAVNQVKCERSTQTTQ